MSENVENYECETTQLNPGPGSSGSGGSELGKDGRFLLYYLFTGNI